MNKDKIIKLLQSKSSDDIRLGIEFLLNMGYNKAKGITNELPATTNADIWRSLGCSTEFWGYFNSSRGTFRIIVAHQEMLVIYKSEQYVKDQLGWQNLD